MGVSQYCDYPPAAAKLPKVGSFLTPNVEAIVGLRPTLIIGLETSANQREIQALQRMGYPVLLTTDDSLQGIEHGIKRIGEVTGRARRANQVLIALDQQLGEVERKLAGVAPRKVLMVVGHNPLVAVGGGYLNELLQMADDVNIAAGLGQQWPRVSLEYIIARSPDVILDGEMGSDRAASVVFWKHYPSIPAVQHNRVYAYDQDPVLRPGPRAGEILEILARLTHPEVFAGSRIMNQTSSTSAIGQNRKAETSH